RSYGDWSSDVCSSDLAGTTAGGLVFGTALADFIAACSQGTTSGTSGGGKLEIFSWWTAGGEADGLAELFKIYSSKYSGVKVVNRSEERRGGKECRYRG